MQTVELGAQWPTIDPFLFCVHHDDAYPAGDGDGGPRASLAGRELGQDFTGVDGWRMYHGLRVPGFPSHPHRGFETVTYVRRGLIDHSDSLGAAARFGSGDTQWLTAGRGIVHAEMFPLLDEQEPNPLELFQIWLNLPAADKMADPHFAMLWAEDTPTVRHEDADGRTTEVTVIAGRLGDAEPPSPPPDSWASRPDADVAIWHLGFEAGARWTMPAAAGAETVRTLYVFCGDGVRVDGDEVGAATGALIRADRDVELEALGATEVLLLQGRPIGEPQARYGPFVMNTEAEIEDAFVEYRATEFGGWPWPQTDPVHGTDARRFARRPDGSRDEPASVNRAGARGVRG
ncbi:MAG: pirin family protein [Ilumatobacteraceae bacterium]